MTQTDCVLRHVHSLAGRGLRSAVALTALLVMLAGCGKATEKAKAIRSWT